MRSEKASVTQAGRSFGPLVLIEWVDSYGCSPRWENIDGEFRPQPMVCQSVGWMIHSDKKAKIIVPHISRQPDFDVPPQGCGDMTIPTRCIIRITSLKEPSARS